MEKNAEKKYCGIDRKTYDLEKVGYSEKYNIRKNMRDIFSIPKSRNKIIKDFKFNRLIDVETYSNLKDHIFIDSQLETFNFSKQKQSYA